MNATNAAEAILLATKPHKSQLKYEIKFDSHQKVHNIYGKQPTKIWTIDF